MKKCLLILLFLVFVASGLSAIELADKKGRTLNLTTDIILEPYFSFNDSYWAFPVPSIDLQFEGNDNDIKGFEVSFDIEELFNNDI